jgi:hypothetical protein
LGRDLNFGNNSGQNMALGLKRAEFENDLAGCAPDIAELRKDPVDCELWKWRQANQTNTTWNHTHVAGPHSVAGSVGLGRPGAVPLLPSTSLKVRTGTAMGPEDTNPKGPPHNDRTRIILDCFAPLLCGSYAIVESARDENAARVLPRHQKSTPRRCFCVAH